MSRSLVALLIAVAFGCASGDETSLDEVQNLLRSGETDEAIERMRDSLSAEPAQPEMQLLYGQVLAQLGHLSLAVWPLRKAAESPLYSRSANLVLAQVLLRMGSGEDAVDAASRVLKEHADDTGALKVRSSGYLLLSREAEALSDIERVLALDPTDLDAHISKAIALLGLAQVEEAERALQAAKERAADISAGLDDEKLTPRLCLAEAMFVAEKGDPDRGEKMLADCLDRFPSDPLVVRESVRLYLEAGKRDDALAILRRAVEEAPEDTGFRMSLAALLREAAAFEEAEAVLLEATENADGPAAWLALFDHYSAVDDHEAARVVMERVKEFGPMPVRLRIAYADTLVLVGDYGGAEREASRLPGGYGDLIRGRILLEQGDAPAALNALERGIQQWPDNVTARWLAGRAAERSGNLARAESHYREAIRSDTQATDAALRLARLYEAMGQIVDAYDAANRYALSHPDDLNGSVLAARLAVRVGTPQAAEGAMKRMSMLPGGRVEAVALRAELQIANGAEPSRVVEVIESSDLDLADPASAPALAVLLQQLSAAGKSDRALEQIDRALQAHPDSSEFHALRGRTLLAAERSAEAKAAFEQAVRFDPENAAALLELARLNRQHDREAALLLYDRAAATDSGSSEAAYEACLLLLDPPARLAEAEDRLAAVLDAHPLNGGAANQLARLIADRGGDLSRAESLARRAVRLRTGLESLETLGQIQLTRGEFELAAATFQRVLEQKPGAGGAQYRLGLALAGMGDVEGAREALRSALETGGFEDEAHARAELARLDSTDDVETQ